MDTELLAIVLRVGQGSSKKGVHGHTALALARMLLTEFGGFTGLDRTDTRDLLRVRGLSVAKVSQIKSALEIGKRLRRGLARRRALDSAEAVAAYLQPHLASARDEVVVGLFLDGQNRLLDEKVISEGTPTQATVYVRRVLEAALRASAAAIVLAHNHTSGECSPSTADDETTLDLATGAEKIGLILIDHVIVGATSYYSYADSGRLDHLRETEPR